VSRWITGTLLPQMMRIAPQRMLANQAALSAFPATRAAALPIRCTTFLGAKRSWRTVATSKLDAPRWLNESDPVSVAAHRRGVGL